MTAVSTWNFLFGRRERRADDHLRETVLTWPTGLTLFRAAVSMTLLAIAIVEQSQALLLAGLAFSMALDFCDGLLARVRRAETILGAQLDGIADRIATAMVAAGTVSMHADAGVVIAATAVWVQFGVLDQLLTSQFLRFGLWSPDHFYELDERGSPPIAVWVWRLNWSALAKLASNLPIVFLAIGAWWVAFGLAVALIAVRIPSYRLIRRLAGGLEESYSKIPGTRRTSAEPQITIERRASLARDGALQA